MTDPDSYSAARDVGLLADDVTMIYEEFPEYLLTDGQIHGLEGLIDTGDWFQPGLTDVKWGHDVYAMGFQQRLVEIREVFIQPKTADGKEVESPKAWQWFSPDEKRFGPQFAISFNLNKFRVKEYCDAEKPGPDSCYAKLRKHRERQRHLKNQHAEEQKA